MSESRRWTQGNPSGSSGCSAPILDSVEMPDTHRISMKISSKQRASDRFLSGSAAMCKKDTERERSKATPIQPPLFAETMREQVKSFDGRIDLPDHRARALRDIRERRAFSMAWNASNRSLVSLKQDPIETPAA